MGRATRCDERSSRTAGRHTEHSCGTTCLESETLNVDLMSSTARSSCDDVSKAIVLLTDWSINSGCTADTTQHKSLILSSASPTLLCGAERNHECGSSTTVTRVYLAELVGVLDLLFEQ